jgi:outer membrane protein OmpA-like peptidoglycan-associated protein
VFGNGEIRLGENSQRYYGGVGLNYRIWGSAQVAREIEKEQRKRKETKDKRIRVKETEEIGEIRNGIEYGIEEEYRGINVNQEEIEAQSLQVSYMEEAAKELETEPISKKEREEIINTEADMRMSDIIESEIERGEPIRAIVAKFGAKEYKLTPQSRAAVRAIAKEIKGLKYIRVIVIGKSSRTVRMELAARRAKSVYDVLYQEGIDIDRLEYIDIGLPKRAEVLGLDQGDFKTNQVEVIVEYLQ